MCDEMKMDVPVSKIDTIETIPALPAPCMIRPMIICIMFLASPAIAVPIKNSRYDICNIGFLPKIWLSLPYMG